MAFKLPLSVRVVLVSAGKSRAAEAHVIMFSKEPQLHVSICESCGMHQPLEAIIEKDWYHASGMFS